MANVKISALPAATSVASADVLPIVQSATTKKATFQNVIDAVVSNEPGTSFRNRIINGDFSINQRGFTSTTTTLTYGQDRWRLVASDGTVTYSAQAFTAGNPITGQEPINYARLVTTGQTLTSAEAALVQPIEDVRTFAGQQVTVSFWAKSASGTPKIAIEFEQRFGSGGSPSGIVQTYGGQATISTSWARYSVTFTVPSISGKTIGTDANSSSVWAKLYVSAGTALNARTGSLGIQTNTFDIWGVQVEAGSTASAFERRPIGTELALCQRYYEQSYPIGTAPGTSTSNGMVVCSGSTDNSGYLYHVIPMNVQKRAMVATGASNASYVRLWTQAGVVDQAGYNRSGTSNTTTSAGVNNGGIGYWVFYILTGAGWVPAYSVFHWVYNCEL